MMRKIAKFAVLSAVVAGAFVIAVQSPAMAAGEHVELIRNKVLAQAKALANDPRVVAAVEAQNRRSAGLGQSDIDRLDKQWRAETAASNRPLIDSVLANELSQYLGKVKTDGRGLYTEIFVMDNKGLNVGQSDVTSDYWQGDEDKWQKTYGKGANAVLIDDVEFDESTQSFQSQLSLPVVDGGTGDVVGAITLGINVDLLK